MKIDLISEDRWQRLNEKVADLFRLRGWTGDFTARVYPGPILAVHDIALGSAQFLSHKRSMTFLAGTTWAYQAVMPFLFREGMQVQELRCKDFADPNELWSKIPRDTNFVLHGEDHPVTGEIFSLAGFEEELTKRRTFYFGFSHSSFLRKSPECKVHPFSVKICNFSDQVTVALFGERYKTPSYFGSYLILDETSILHKIENEFARFTENKEQVLAFEQALVSKAPSFKKYFDHEQRLFDRAVLYNEDINAESFAKQMSSRISFPAFSSANLCHFNETLSFHKWWNPLPKEELIRGMCLVDSQHLSKVQIDEVPDVLSACTVKF